jgi:hypothetical protein
MKFSIADILWTTVAAAFLFAAIRTVNGFVVAFVLLNLAQVVLPIGILLLTILFADQRGSMLDIATVPGWRILKRIWILSILCTIAVWLMLFGLFQ